MYLEPSRLLFKILWFDGVGVIGEEGQGSAEKHLVAYSKTVLVSEKHVYNFRHHAASISGFLHLCDYLI